jgi:hypothetical protein
MLLFSIDSAQVSDFYIPDDRMSQHKIHSSDSWSLQLDIVPKRLKTLTNEWAPHAFVVSFKLETNEDILLQQAQKAIDKYDVHVVVANLLQTRREACVLVERPCLESDVVAQHVIKDSSSVANLEALIVLEIVEKHKQFMAAKITTLSDVMNSENIQKEIHDLFSIAAQSPCAMETQDYLKARNDFDVDPTASAPHKVIRRRHLRPLVDGLLWMLAIGGTLHLLLTTPKTQ